MYQAADKALDKPPPCNYFYLLNCKHGERCRYGHDYDMSQEHVDELRVNAKKWPCPYLNTGKHVQILCLIAILR